MRNSSINNRGFKNIFLCKMTTMPNIGSLRRWVSIRMSLARMRMTVRTAILVSEIQTSIFFLVQKLEIVGKLHFFMFLRRFLGSRRKAIHNHSEIIKKGISRPETCTFFEKVGIWTCADFSMKTKGSS